jgi:hypothetical protein
VARALEGEWKLTASHGINESVEVVRTDSLPAFLPLELEHDISGHVPSIWCEPEIVLQVDIDVIYLGMENEKNRYKTSYRYDFQNQKMTQQ